MTDWLSTGINEFWLILNYSRVSLNETCWSQFDKNLKRLVLCDETSSLVVNLDFNPIPVIVFKCIES